MIDTSHLKASWALRLIAGIFLIGALGDWPYSYYQVLRWVVALAGAHAAWVFFSEKRNGWAIFFVSAAILFNPLSPISMARESWQLFDIAGGIGFLSSLALLKRQGASN